MKDEKKTKKTKSIVMTIQDRILFPQILPRETGMIDAILKKALMDKVVLTPDEIEKSGIKQKEDGKVQWKQVGNTDKGLELNKTEVSFLQKAVEEMDKGKRIVMDMLPLCEKIMEL